MGHTDGRPQVHQPLIQVPGAARREHAGNDLRDAPPERSAPRGKGDVAQACDHALGISVHRRDGKIIGHARDGPGGVGPNPRVGAQSSHIGGRKMEPLLHHRPCRVQQVAATGIIAESLPELENLRFVRACQGREIRISRHPPFEVGQNRLDLGLLEHELRDQHLIGIVILAPRQPAGVDRKPVRQQPAAERLPFFRMETVP